MREGTMLRTALATFGLLVALLLGACDDAGEEQPPATPEQEAPAQQ